MARYDKIAEVEKTDRYDEIEEVQKFNPFHDSRGRFSSANGYASFTMQTRDPKKQHMADMAIARMKQQAAQQAAQQPQPKPAPQPPPKPTKNLDPLGYADHDDADYHALYNRRAYYQQQQLTAAQRKAAGSYMEADPEPGSLYSHSQNMNYRLANGQKLTGKYKQTYDGVTDAMHNTGYNITATRYDHAGFVNSILAAAGLGNYEHMSQQQLQKALIGKKVSQGALLSFSTDDFAKAPASTRSVFATRAVKINGHIKANTQSMMPGKGPGGDLGEIILGPTNGTMNKPGRITGVRLTGQMVRRKGTQLYNQPRIEIDIEYES